MKSLSLKHFFLTRFSYRPQSKEGRALSGADWSVRHDPLSTDSLDFRYRLFESACLPGIAAQSNQDFDWVLIVDPDLPAAYREKLELMLSKMKQVHLHEIRPDDNLERLEWLERHIPDGTEYVLTTLLDDDDILPISFVERLHSHITELGQTIPSLKTFGVKTSFEWDLFCSTRYPYGKLSPWHRGNWFRSVGYSMLCRLANHRLTVFSLDHRAAEFWYEQRNSEQLAQIIEKRWRKRPVNKKVLSWHVSEFQKKMKASAGSDWNDWMSFRPSSLCHNLSNDGVSVVQINHFLNDQRTRLLEQKEKSIRVVGLQSFPTTDELRIDFDAIDRQRKMFSLSWKQFNRYTSEIWSLGKRFQLGLLKRSMLFIMLFVRLAWWFLRH